MKQIMWCLISIIKSKRISFFFDAKEENDSDDEKLKLKREEESKPIGRSEIKKNCNYLYSFFFFFSEYILTKFGSQRYNDVFAEYTTNTNNTDNERMVFWWFCL